MKSTLLSLVLLFASIPLWLQTQNEAVPQSALKWGVPPQEELDKVLSEDASWLKNLLGTLPSSSADNAAQFEILRWQEHPLFDGKILHLETKEDQETGSFSIHLEAVGVTQQILPWVQHLLRAPYSLGYLVDPTLLRIRNTDDNRLHLAFQVQILPAATLLAEIPR